MVLKASVSVCAAQIVSEFTFKQDNTIADEPMVELLRYLTPTLEQAALRAGGAGAGGGRGQVLQQLVLIISDGRFHEKVRRRDVKAPLLQHLYSSAHRFLDCIMVGGKNRVALVATRDRLSVIGYRLAVIG